MSDDLIVPNKWWEILPRKIYKTLMKVETRQPWFDVYKLHDWLYAIYEGGQFDEPLMYLLIGAEIAVVIDGGNGIGNFHADLASTTSQPMKMR